MLIKNILYLFLFLVLITGLSALQTSAGESITYTPEEIQWIDSHPVIRLGVPESVEPIIIKKNNLPLSGAIIDFTKELNQRSGLDIRIISDSLSNILEMAIAKSIDGIIVLHPDKADSLNLLKTKTYFKVYPSIFVHKKNTFKDLEDLEGKTIAHIDGGYFAERILAPYRNKIKIVTASSELKALQMVNDGEVDFALGLSTDTFQIFKYRLNNIKRVYDFKHDPVKSVMGIRSDWAPLVPILNKSIGSFSKEELESILNRWSVDHLQDSSIDLSIEEALWVQRHPFITLAIGNTYPPLNFLDNQGLLTGLSVDYVNYIAGKIGIKIKYADSSWPIAINKARNNEVDGIVNVDATEKSKAHLNFTQPYATYPSGLITLRTNSVIKSIEQIGNRDICVKKGSSYFDLIQKKTDAKIIEIETLEEGLDQVLEGKAFGIFDDASVLGYLISKYNFVNLKINLVIYDDFIGVTRLGLRNNDPVMLAVFNKAIRSISKKEKEVIQSRWISLIKEEIVFETQFDWNLFYKIMIPFCLTIATFYLLIMVHNKRLKRVVERKTKDLQESKEQFQALIDHAADAVYVHDLEGNILKVNQQACLSTGYDVLELMNMSIHDTIDQKINTTDLNVMWTRLVPGKPVTLETAQIRKNGTTLPIEVNLGSIEYHGEKAVLALARDITKRQKTEQDRIMLSTVIEQTNEAIIITDSEGIIQYVNPAFEEIAGYTKREVIGGTPRILKSGKHEPEFYQQLWSEIKSGRVWRGHFINRRKDGSLYEEDALITPIKASSGEIINFVGVNRDLTQELEFETRLRQAQKMEAIGTLAGGIAHDFNNILGAIIGYTELSLISTDKPEVLDDYLNKVLKASQRAKDLVQQILAFSRQTELEKQPVKMGPLIKEAMKFIQASLPSTIRFETHINTDSDIILADATQIHQVLMNLFTNAGYAMKQTGGTMVVTLDPIQLGEEDLQLYPGRTETGPYLKLSVTDTGTGISADVLERIFEPYYTTKKKGEGTGLGLSVVHGIVKEHEGDITVYSEPGKGTSFNVIIPLTESIDQQVVYEPETELPHGSEVIMVVDDEKDLTEIMKRILTGLGYKVIACQKPEDALEKFKQQFSEIDMIITDKTMPGMTGFELAHQIRDVNPETPVVLCSGFLEKDDLSKKEKSGILKIMMKPVNKKNLADLVRSILDQV